MEISFRFGAQGEDSLQVLWEDGERMFCRGSRLGADGGGGSGLRNGLICRLLSGSNMFAVRRMMVSLGALLLALYSPVENGFRIAAAQPNASSQAQDVVRRHEHVRFWVSYRYGYDILDAALEHSVARYGTYKVEPVVTEMSVARLRREILEGDLLNVVVYPAGRKEIDEGLIPIDIPLDQGLLGYRIAFIRATEQDRVDQVRDIRDLRQLRIGTGEQWAEVPIYEYNDIPLMTARNSELLLPMLAHGRLDLFPRGITQLFSEYATYKDKYPSLAIDQHLLIYFPSATYIFVSKTAPRLAERIRYGLQEMEKDGSFDRRFDLYFAQAIADLHLPLRTIIELENPFLPPWAKISKPKWK